MKRKRKRRRLVNPPRERGLQNASKANVGHLAKKVKPRTGEIVYARARRKATLTVLALLKSKNVKTHHVLMLCLEKSGNAVAKNP